VGNTLYLKSLSTTSKWVSQEGVVSVVYNAPESGTQRFGNSCGKGGSRGVMATEVRAAISSISYPLVLSTEVCAMRPSHPIANLITTPPATSACWIQLLQNR